MIKDIDQKLAVSEIFHTDFGDFALISSDDVMFYVPQSVLQYCSGVFRTMFEIEVQIEDKKPVHMQADAAILTTILTFASPNLPDPSVIDLTRLGELLRVAKQYEMDAVFDQLRKTFREIQVVDNSVVEPLVVRVPMESLVVAHGFNCINEARLALREVIKDDSSKDPAGDFGMSVDLGNHIINLRLQRGTWFAAKLDMIISKAAVAVVIGPVGAMQWSSKSTRELMEYPSILTLRRIIAGGITSGYLVAGTAKRIMQLEVEPEASVLEAALPELEQPGPGVLPTD